MNSLYESIPFQSALIRIYEIPTGNLVFNQSVDGSLVPEDGVLKIYALPNDINLPSTYFLRLTLSYGDDVDDNIYWMSTTPDVLDWNDSNFFRTPCSSYANFTALEQLPPVQLKV